MGRLRDEMVGEGARRAEDGQQAVARPPRRGQRRGEPLVVCPVRHPLGRLHEPDEAEQRLVGVGDVGEGAGQPVALDPVTGVDQGGDHGLLEEAQGAGRVGEPQPGQRPGDALPAMDGHNLGRYRSSSKAVTWLR